MTPEHAAHDTRHAVVTLPAMFMSDAATHEYGAQLGFKMGDFYTAGRGGALGDVPADVVVAAFVFFAPERVRAAWERSAAVLPRREAAQEWAGCLHRWARTQPDHEVDWERVDDLLGKIVAGAAVAGAPLFAGWRTLPEPIDAQARGYHRLNGLRELRGGMHGAAVLTVGLTPHQAISAFAPKALRHLGWTEPAAEAEPLKDRWALAEARTDRMVGRHFTALTDAERVELVELLQRAAS